MKLFNIFKRSLGERQKDSNNWNEGYEAFNKGKQYFYNKQNEEALELFDKAIEYGFDIMVYGLRATCLQALGYDLDAIDDYNKAIESTSKDCNLYFQRALSKSNCGDREGSINDFKEAIKLSKTDNDLNRNYLKGVKEMNWHSHTEMYEQFLNIELMKQETELNLKKLGKSETRLKLENKRRKL